MAFGNIANMLDRAGFRRPLAAAASLAYRGRSFSVDDAGFWVNEQAEATIVSPTIHTADFAQVRDIVVETATFHYSPRPGDVILDIGAGIGEDAVALSPLVAPGGRIIAVEAHPRTFECLRWTVSRSGAVNVEPLHFAIAAEDGVITISDSDDHLANSIGSGGGIAVRARSIESLADELGIGDVALLRMNIEGAERLALRGLGKMIRSVRSVVISCHDFLADRTGNDWFRTKDEVRAYLSEHQFELLSRPVPADRPWLRDYVYARRANP